MIKIRVAFYKNSKSLFWKLIRWKQRKNLSQRYAWYSHVELVFEDWQSFSSSEEDKWVRFKKIKFKDYNWDFIDLDVYDWQYDKILNFCKRQENNWYNWWGIVFAQTLNFNVKGEWDWFCSEICARALQEASFLCPQNSLFINPWQLAKLLEIDWFLLKF